MGFVRVLRQSPKEIASRRFVRKSPFLLGTPVEGITGGRIAKAVRIVVNNKTV